MSRELAARAGFLPGAIVCFGLGVGAASAGAWPDGPEAAAAALRSGDWATAEAEYRAFLDREDCDEPRTARGRCAAARRGLGETLRLTGRYRQALTALTEPAGAASTPAVLLDRARVRLEVGEGREAAALLRELLADEASLSLSEAVAAASQLGRLELRLGEREAGLARLDGVIEAYNRVPAGVFSSRGLVAVGRAAAALGYQSSGLFRDALRVFDDAAALDLDDPAPHLAAGDLLLSKFNSAEAQNSFDAVLSRNPNHPAALLGLARLPPSVRRAPVPGDPGGSGPAPRDPLERALAVNPVQPAARSLEIHRLLEAGRHEEARSRAEDAAEALPAAPEILAALGAVHFVTGEPEALSGAERRFAAAWPGDPAFHTGLAEAAERQRLYSEAADRASAALEVSPSAPAPARILGLNQLRLGDMDAGRRTLEAAFGRDPFDALLKNNLDLLDELAGFEVLAAPSLEIALPRDEARLLGPYAVAVATEALDFFRNRYGFEPAGTIRIEIYDRSADFSVRTVGIPGIGAHGVCFGRVVAMESPSARPAGSYHWASTLWHELAHAVHMERTGNRVPRWFTEGLSVLDERRRYGDGAPLAFFAALRDGRLLDLAHLDEGFIRPRWPGQVQVSYFHASLVLETLENDHGFAAVLAVLDGFGQGLDFESALAEAVDVPVAELDSDVNALIEERYGTAARGLAGAERREGAMPGAPFVGPVPPGAGTGLVELLAAADGAPNDFVRQLRAGAALLEAGRDEDAMERLLRAAGIAPGYGGGDGPFRLLARIHAAAGRPLEAEEALAEHVARVPAAYPEWLELAELRRAAGNLRGAAAALTAANWAYPLHAAPHEQLADLARELDDPKLEIREREAVLATDPADRADALHRLAEAHFLAGDRAAARRRVLEALEIAPTFDAALRLLLDLRRSG